MLHLDHAAACYLRADRCMARGQVSDATTCRADLAHVVWNSARHAAWRLFKHVKHHTCAQDMLLWSPPAHPQHQRKRLLTKQQQREEAQNADGSSTACCLPAGGPSTVSDQQGNGCNKLLPDTEAVTKNPSPATVLERLRTAIDWKVARGTLCSQLDILYRTTCTACICCRMQNGVRGSAAPRQGLHLETS